MSPVRVALVGFLAWCGLVLACQPPDCDHPDCGTCGEDCELSVPPPLPLPTTTQALYYEKFSYAFMYKPLAPERVWNCYWILAIYSCVYYHQSSYIKEPNWSNHLDGYLNPNAMNSLVFTVS